MSHLHSRFAAGVLVLLIGTVWADDFSPSPVPIPDQDEAPYKYTGIVESDFGSGSGSVAVHPQLVLGCAHVNYDDLNYEWLSEIRWHWKWNDVGFPPGGGLLMDGQYDFATYGTNVRKSRWGSSDPKSFNVDFVVNYSTVDTAGGEYADWIENGGSYLQSRATPKFITGYPAGRYDDGDPAEYRMHETGPFSGKFVPEVVKLPDYLGLDGVETGPGNSGGPIWGDKDGDWAVAGVLISGAEFADEGYSSAGVYAIGRNAWSRISSALGTVGALPGQLSGTFAVAGVPAAITDAAPTPATIFRKFTVSGMVGHVNTMMIDLAINHARRADLNVTLRSPAGITIPLQLTGSRKSASPRNLVFTGKAVTGFRSHPANGVWILSVKDSFPGNTGTLTSASLAITTR
jgi:V8-like Glu-specific endopeptidase